MTNQYEIRYDKEDDSFDLYVMKTERIFGLLWDRVEYGLHFHNSFNTLKEAKSAANKYIKHLETRKNELRELNND